MTREEWARHFLRKIGAPESKRNLLVVISWAQAEGGTALWNPLNSTKYVPGSTVYNWANVRNYPSYSAGMQATVETLNYGADRGLYGYRQIRHLLRASARPKRTLRAIERSDWGTGGLALRVLPYARADFERYSSYTISGS